MVIYVTFIAFNEFLVSFCEFIQAQEKAFIFSELTVPPLLYQFHCS